MKKCFKQTGNSIFFSYSAKEFGNILIFTIFYVFASFHDKKRGGALTANSHGTLYSISNICIIT